MNTDYLLRTKPSKRSKIKHIKNLGLSPKEKYELKKKYRK